MATTTGVPKIETPPWMVTVDGVTFMLSAIAGIEGAKDLLNSHAGGSRSVKITYDAGPPVTVSKVESV